jgi:phenylacetate-CoA ligase
MSLSILVPCLNEAAGLPELVRRAARAVGAPALADAGPIELVFVDDGSADETWSRLEGLGAAHAGVAVRAVRHPRREGIPSAWRSAVAAARGEWVCTLDADLQYEPEEIARLWQARAQSGADLVQGVRAGARPRDLRFVISRGLSGLLNVVFGMSLRDNKSGFFLCRRETLAALLEVRGRFHHWQCFVMVAAHHRGLRIEEVDTPFHPRRAGKSAFGALALGPALGVAVDFVTALREYPPVRS